MLSLLEQARKGVQCVVQESPSAITILRYPYKDNGLGGRVFNTAEAPVSYRFKGRLVQESPRVQRNDTAPSGSDTSFTMFLLVDYSVEIYEGETFLLYGHTWTLGAVQELHRFGGRIGSQAPLTKGSL